MKCSPWWEIFDEFNKCDCISFLSTGTNVCKDNNGGCQQLCLYRGNAQRTCACAHGMLAEDGRGCRDYDGYLLYSERTILKSVHLSDENNLNAPIKPFEDPEHMKNVIALTFDYRGGGGKGANRIFFSDIHFGNIQRISDDGSDRKTVVESEYSHIFRLSKTHRVDIGPVISHNGLSAWFTPLIFE